MNHGFSDEYLEYSFYNYFSFLIIQILIPCGPVAKRREAGQVCCSVVVRSLCSCGVRVFITVHGVYKPRQSKQSFDTEAALLVGAYYRSWFQNVHINTTHVLDGAKQTTHKQGLSLACQKSCLGPAKLCMRSGGEAALSHSPRVPTEGFETQSFPLGTPALRLRPCQLCGLLLIGSMP